MPKLVVSVFLAVAATLASVPAQAEKRVALVIGNGAYQHFGSLPNPGNDGEDMAAALRGVGFEVIEARDISKRGMDRRLAAFARAAQDADAAVVFYAGHGLQYRGQNYLVPIDAKLEDEIDLEYETIRLDDVMRTFDRVRGVRVLILDACRNLPLPPGRMRSDVFSNQGLSRISGRKDMIVAYATQPDAVAFDGSGRNSFFTGALVKQVGEPGLEIGQLFQRVSAEVTRQTQKRQTPEISRSFAGEFYLNRGETDAQAWVRVRASSDPAELRAFVDRHPTSFYADDAKARIALIEQLSAAQESSRRRADEIARVKLEQEAAARAALELQARQKAEQEAAARMTAEQQGKQKAEQERLARLKREEEQRAEQERVARLRQEEARKREEELAWKRLEADQRRRAEELAARHKSEQERLAQLRREQEDAERKKVEQQRLAQLKRDEEERSRAEQQRLAQTRIQEEQSRMQQARREKAEQEQQRQSAQSLASVGTVGADQRRLSGLHEDEQERLAWAALEEEQKRRALEADSARAGETRAQPGGDQRFEVASLPDPVGQERRIPAVAPLPDNSAAISPPVSGKPVDTENLVRAAQKELGRLGCYDGSPTGELNGMTRTALERYRRRIGAAPSREVTDDFVRELKARRGRVCPLECEEGERPRGNQCVAEPKRKPQPVAAPKTKERPVATPKKERPQPVAAQPKREPVASARARSEPVAARPRAAPVAAAAPAAAAPRASSGASPVLGVGF